MTERIADEEKILVDAEFGDAGVDAELPDYADEKLASQFVDMWGHRYRYVPERKLWFVYRDTHWVADRTLQAFNTMRTLCANVARALMDNKAIEPAARKKYATWIASAKKVTDAEKLARADRSIALEVSSWDADPWVLNTPSCTVDLRTGKSRSNRSEDYCTKITAVGPGGDCPLWLEVLRTWTGYDHDLISFLQRFIGYVLTGLIREHVFLFLWGLGANGKSTFLETIIGILGDYAKVTGAETFMEARGERHPADIASLLGARLVVAQEMDAGDKWAMPRIKSVTGGDKMSARFMRQDFFEFAPTCKLMFAGNHRPGLRTVDEAIRRRMNLVPFRVTIPQEKRDPLLRQKLREEWPGILQWAINGCLEWQRIGLDPPDSVRVATEDYLGDEDALALWIEERIDKSPSAFASTSSLHNSYQAWATRSGEKFFGMKRLSQMLEDRGFERGRDPDGSRARGFCGMRLKEPETQEKLL